MKIQKISSTSIPILDKIVFADPCYLIGESDGEENWLRICNLIINYSLVTIYLSNVQGGEAYLMFGDTYEGDGSYPIFEEDSVIKIKTQSIEEDEDYEEREINDARLATLGVDAGLIGVLTCNQKALDTNMITYEDDKNGKLYYNKPIPMKKSLIILKSFEKGVLEFAFT